MSPPTDAASDVVMPRLSDTMEEGTVLRWLKQDGEHVQRGEPLVEIETDKAAMTYESDLEGVLHTVAREGDTLAVGELIARVGMAGDSPPAAQPGRQAVPTAAATERADAQAGEQADTAAGEQADTPAGGHAQDPAGRQTDTPAGEHADAPAGEPSLSHEADRVKASPLARRIAREAGVELRTLHGSGPGGRIVKADVQSATGATPASTPASTSAPLPASASTPAPAPSTTSIPAEDAPAIAAASVSSKGETTSVELTRMQRTIARRMAESKATIPDFSLTTEIDMERCVELRAELKRLSHVEAPTYNDMILKACALALREHPRANGSYRDARFELHARVNVGVAVAVAPGEHTAGALVVPTVFDADTKALGEIARETRTLAERVRAGTVTPPELSGATFTISNLGMYGIASFTAIVNPPQAAILAIGAVEQRAVVRDSQLLARHMMSVTLACDHRILYGADAALFLARVRELLEEPAALTL
jgi:pyruvate dehydrogenase E2 component (dihydrolipoamide acetyltransferase)